MTDLQNKTRLHSSRMRAARALTVSPIMLCTGEGRELGVHGPSGHMVWGGAWSGGGWCIVPGGAWSQGGVVSQHVLRETPLRTE